MGYQGMRISRSGPMTAQGFKLLGAEFTRKTCSGVGFSGGHGKPLFFFSKLMGKLRFTR